MNNLLVVDRFILFLPDERALRAQIQCDYIVYLYSSWMPDMRTVPRQQQNQNALIISSMDDGRFSLFSSIICFQETVLRPGIKTRKQCKNMAICFGTISTIQLSYKYDKWSLFFSEI